MGRKPNHLIQTYFERGPKLPDNSNRYKQTCKRCGEKFEKGRQEALEKHITKTCQGVSLQERERFLHEVKASRPGQKAKKRTSNTVPLNLDPDLSALQALAEVSGQAALSNAFIAQTPEFPDHPVGYRATAEATSLSITSSAPFFPALVRQTSYTEVPSISSVSAELQLAAAQALSSDHDDIVSDLDATPVTPRSEGIISYDRGEPPIIESAYSRHAPLVQVLPSALVRAGGSSDHVPAQIATDEELVACQGAQTHIAAQHELDESSRQDSYTNAQDERPPETGRGQRNVDGRYVTNMDSRAAAELPQKIETHTRDTDTRFPVSLTSGWDDWSSEAHSYDHQAPQFHYWSANGNSIPGPKKVRGAFAQDRRAAIKEVRKRGACLRCRMLKKSCDAGDPCRECGKLENARMWKGQCIRIRLHQIFTLYSSALFMIVERRAMECLAKESLPGRVEISYFPESGLFMTFAALRTTGGRDGLMEVLIDSSEDNLSENTASGSKFNQYTHRLLHLLFSGVDPKPTIMPLSKLMDETVRAAFMMSSRVLTARVLDLFICCLMLTKPPDSLCITYEAHLEPCTAPIECERNLHAPSVAIHFAYIQLRRKLEKACDVYFKAVMTELEKALIQRKQVDNFETFIGTIILLRCVEMTCHMYAGFEPMHGDSPSSEVILYGTERWPLQDHPAFYWQQGEQFSDLLANTLKLRKVVPAYQIRHGRLVAEDAVQPAKDWFKAVDIATGRLREAEERPNAEATGNTSQWELRFIGKLFDI